MYVLLSTTCGRVESSEVVRATLDRKNTLWVFSDATNLYLTCVVMKTQNHCI